LSFKYIFKIIFLLVYILRAITKITYMLSVGFKMLIWGGMYLIGPWYISSILGIKMVIATLAITFII